MSNEAVGKGAFDRFPNRSSKRRLQMAVLGSRRMKAVRKCLYLKRIRKNEPKTLFLKARTAPKDICLGIGSLLNWFN